MSFKPGDEVILIKSDYIGDNRKAGCVVTLDKKHETAPGWYFIDDRKEDGWYIAEKKIRKLSKLEKAMK